MTMMLSKNEPTTNKFRNTNIERQKEQNKYHNRDKAYQKYPVQ